MATAIHVLRMRVSGRDDTTRISARQTPRPAPARRRGGRRARVLCWILSIIMFINGVGHLAGSAYFHRWLPGATSAPLLLVASLLLVQATRRQHSREPEDGRA
jgi:hypothetical protein